ncbi:hypothetical protein CAOG_07767 [Capsaspora owczarzaki ATCC 30864]|uniref:3-dehydrosphinganine reductase n=1 Tax=Capsaspora owczarzaki (strain ATCC 30864) TaxID=595528 RepID=A0A0D2W0E6_CAPO3|nr:hypothetical protein CAOG_07767 [Capsaspora owczarzaki ATCC 30864]KJE97657.1 hypothetical protein CAOG_007767 [Capsaspora owczarzaki ATCC 30864]|eukprot:XP_004342840.1 hypothetical protein CAOG_07767 [Capsaspora owczarzaki ATCC 30864]
MLGWLLPFDSTLANGVLIYASLVALSWLYRRLVARPGLAHFRGQHVFITGGSQGLGLSLAASFARLGANVTIVSRKLDVLNQAKAEIVKRCSASPGNVADRVLPLACDVTQFEQVEKAVAQAAAHFKQPVHTLVACAGSAMPGRFVDQSVDDIKRMMDLNHHGCVHAAKAVVPGMLASSAKGRTLVFVNSGCGLTCFYGYAGYCASKWAQRGFAEALRNELVADGVRVCVYYPPNMDTPGFVEENKTKPKVTAEIEGSSGILTPDQAAAILMEGLASGNDAVTADPLSELARIQSGSNASPLNVFLDLAILPISRIVWTGAYLFMNHVVRSAHRQQQKRD